MTVQHTFIQEEELTELPTRYRGQLLQAIELFLSPDAVERSHGLDKIVNLKGHLRSPVASAVLATRILEPQLEIRSRIVSSISVALRPSANVARPPLAVRRWLRFHLAQMRQPQVYGLLRLAVEYEEQFSDICDLLSSCSYAGESLEQILGDRQVEISVRTMAARAIGEAGFLDSAATLKDLATRMETRHGRQLGMGFAPDPDPEAELLLPAVVEALTELEDRV